MGPGMDLGRTPDDSLGLDQLPYAFAPEVADAEYGRFWQAVDPDMDGLRPNFLCDSLECLEEIARVVEQELGQIRIVPIQDFRKTSRTGFFETSIGMILHEVTDLLHHLVECQDHFRLASPFH